MSELDVAKEKIAYLKVWLATTLLLWAAVVAVVALSVGILLLHRRIDRHIQSLRRFK